VSGPLFVEAAANRAFAEVETARRAGDWARALGLALRLLRRRLSRGTELEVGDCVLIERVADLAAPFGLTDAADRLLAGLGAHHARARRFFPADYVTLKRVHLAQLAGDAARALRLLEALRSRIGPLEEVPIAPAALPAWEDHAHWPDARRTPDRALFLSRLYLAAGRWLADQGRYGHAAVLLERGAAHAAPPASALACRARLPLRLALAGVFLEQGRLEEAAQLLDGLDAQFQENEGPGWLVRWLELSGQLNLLRGDYGDAVERFARVVDLCARGGFARATLGALLNQARILILLNQVGLAEETFQKTGGAGASQVAVPFTTSQAAPRPPSGSLRFTGGYTIALGGSTDIGSGAV
jgi:hypothetical protein